MPTDKKRRLRRVLGLTFVTSLFTALVEFGIYFYTDERYGFSVTQNFIVALLFGAGYIFGAQVSHALTNRFGPWRTLMAVMCGAASLLVVLLLEPASWVGPTLADGNRGAAALDAAPFAQVAMVTGINALFAVFNGSTWAIVESYITHGLTPKQASRAVGWFNITWASTVVIALGIAGALIEAWGPLLFAVSVGLAAIGIFLASGLPRQLEGLAHPPDVEIDDTSESIAGPVEATEAAEAVDLDHTRALLNSSRWSLLASYTLVFLLSPLLPEIFRDRLGQSVTMATIWASLIHFVRLLVFLAMAFTVGWHGRAWLLILSIALLPGGAALVLFGDSLLIVGLGQALFGLAAGLTYYAALYYAMVVASASVEAGGDHEGIIGTGFLLGPAIGLLGGVVTGVVGGSMLAIATASLPVVVVCVVGGALPLWRRR